MIRKQSRKSSKIYSYHVANLREIESAITHIGLLARKEISSKDPQKSLYSLLRLYSFLIGAWIETRLKKLLHEQDAFSNDERDIIEKKPTQLEQWLETVDLAFRKKFNINKAKFNQATLGVDQSARRDALREVLNQELRILIEIRNKLAHGQWKYPFNNEGTEVESEKYKLINKENLLSLQFKYDLAKHLANAVHDLVVSPIAFQRDFEQHFKKLNQVRINIKNRSYDKYEASMVSCREKARFTIK